MHNVGRERDLSLCQCSKQTGFVFSKAVASAKYLFIELKINRDESILHVPSKRYAYAPNNLTDLLFASLMLHVRFQRFIELKKKHISLKLKISRTELEKNVYLITGPK